MIKTDDQTMWVPVRLKEEKRVNECEFAELLGVDDGTGKMAACRNWIIAMFLVANWKMHVKPSSYILVSIQIEASV